MKKLLVLGLVIAVFPLTSWAQRCGNDCNGSPVKCNGCKRQGANPFTAYSGSVARDVTDLEMFGGIGEERLAFTRTSTSRYKPMIPTPLGTGGSWRHSYYWHILPAGTDPVTNTEIIHVDSPDGAEQDFHKETTSSIYLTAVSATQERIEALPNNEYYLWFPDGRHLWFKKVIAGTAATFSAARHLRQIQQSSRL